MQNVRAELKGVDGACFACVSQDVGSIATIELVGIATDAADEQVGPGSAREGVVAAIAIQLVVTGPAIQQVVALFRQRHTDHIRIAVELVVARSAIQGIVATQPDQRVVAVQAVHPVGSVGADEGVVARRAIQIEATREEFGGCECAPVGKLEAADG